MLFSALVLAGGALALSRPDCFAEHGRALAAYSNCARHDALAPCFVGLSSHSVDDIEACLITAGCAPSTALVEAREALDRCDDWARASELRRRVRAYVPHMPARTVNPFAAGHGSSPNPRPTDHAGAMALNRLFGRADEGSKISGDDCFDLSTKDTSQCDVSTDRGKEISSNCKATSVVESSCKQGMTCSMDKTGTNVCMELQDTLSTAGIIISIVFAAALVLGIGSLTYLCCQDRRQQKRLAAKAEATALARAATKKQRSKEVRAPLMAQQDDQPPQIHAPLGGGGDPFGDQNRS